MLGYDSWHELHKVTSMAKHPPSLLDEEVAGDEQRARIDYQTNVLGRVSPLIEPVRRQITLKLRVSAGRLSSDKFEEDAYRHNAIVYYVDPFQSEGEWRFVPSIRSAEMSEQLGEAREWWEQGEQNFGDYMADLEVYLKEQPENISAITNLLTASLNVDALEMVKHRLLAFEKIIYLPVAIGFPERKKAILPWSTLDNRDFHRAVSLLAECFYRTGDFKRAKRWFNFSIRTCDEFVNYIAPYLEDLRRPSPTGFVRWEGDE